MGISGFVVGFGFLDPTTARLTRPGEPTTGNARPRPEPTGRGREPRGGREESGLERAELTVRLRVFRSVVVRTEVGEHDVEVLELREIRMTIEIPLREFLRRLDDVVTQHAESAGRFAGPSGPCADGKMGGIPCASRKPLPSRQGSSFAASGASPREPLAEF